MPGLYIDTSALGRILLAEPDTAAIRAALGRFDAWWSSELLVVELRRLAAKEGVVETGEALLAEVSLYAVDRALLDLASRIPPIEVRSLDAIHLQTAVTLRDAGTISAVMTYDHQLRRGCEHHGIPAEAP
ncbi:MAG: PIN domain-containing protein [Solirubrobacteraceae bacterium]